MPDKEGEILEVTGDIEVKEEIKDEEKKIKKKDRVSKPKITEVEIESRFQEFKKRSKRG